MSLKPKILLSSILFFDYSKPNEWNLLSGSTLWLSIGEAYGEDYVGINSASFYSEAEAI